jgi:hypothetical protein
VASRGAKIAAVLGIAGGVAAAVAAVALGQPAGPSLTVNGQSGTVTVQLGAPFELEATGGTPNGPCAWYQCRYPVSDPTPVDYPEPCPAFNSYQSFDNGGVWGPSDFTGYNDGTYYFAVLDLTTGEVSNWVEVIVSATG